MICVYMLIVVTLSSIETHRTFDVDYSTPFLFIFWKKKKTGCFNIMKKYVYVFHDLNVDGDCVFIS